ncbi:MAG: sulfate adenylyltransferase subunit 1 [Planctomycetota bacterium]|jgi:sulfate adenylyltransferase large subunit
MDILSFVIVGHVDHGKSTLIGRLLYDTGSLAFDKIEEVRQASAEQGKETEFAYLLDHFEEERKQGITIDTTQVFFKTPRRCYTIIDAPGHVEFVKNMITGASHAEAAVLIVDVNEGVKEQTKRHSYILSLLGLNQVIVVLNKMDLVDFSAGRFETVIQEVQEWLKAVDITPLVYVPISAIKGDNIAGKSENMDWYAGPTFLESLDALQNMPPAQDKPLLLPIQDVYKMQDKRISVGRVESGAIKKGAEVKALPGGHVTSVLSIEKFLEDTDKAIAGECIGLTTADPVFLERGNVLCSPQSQPILTDKIAANIFWMSKRDFDMDLKLTIRCATQELRCKVVSIDKRIDSSTLELLDTDCKTLKNLEVAEITIETEKPVIVKNFNDVQELGRFVLVQDQNICASGIITSIS